jgi:hypothetical protein
MRRFSLLSVLLVAMLVVPAASQAATPGVNIAHPDTSQLAAAQLLGAKYVRVFARRQEAVADPNKFRVFANQARNLGMGVVYVLVGDAGGGWAPPDPSDFASFAHTFAVQMAGQGVTAYEVWNEEDETLFWAGTPSAAQYAAVVKAAYPAIKSADPAVKVLLGPLTGNNYDFLSQV